MQRSNIAEIVNYTLAEQGPGRIAAPAGSSEVGDLGRILSCRRALILGAALVSGLLGFLYVCVTRSEYAATAQILIDPRDRQIVSNDVNPDTLAADGGIIQVESQSKVIESDAVLLRAVRALKLAEDPDYGARKPGLVAEMLNILTGAEETEGPAADEARALRVLRKHLAIKRAEKVFVVDVVVTAYSGSKAANIADAVAEAYLSDQIQSRSDSSSRASDALTGRLVKLRQDVEAAADAVERFKGSHNLLGTDRQTISDQQLNDNGTQLNNARAAVSELQARVDQIDALRRSGSDGGAVPEAIRSGVVTQLRSSQSELMRRRSDMRTRLGERHPDLIALDAEIQQTQTLINAELDRLMRSAHSDLDRAKKNERTLTVSQEALKQQTISNNQAFVTLQELVRDLDARRSVYQAFLARAGETKEQSGIDNSNARILSTAIPPVLPSWPLRPIILLGALVGGLGLGAALAFVVEYLAPTVLSGAQLEAAANAPVVGMIPAPAPYPSRFTFPLFRRFRRKRPAVGTAMALGLALSRLCGPPGTLRARTQPHTMLLTEGHAVSEARIDIAAELVLAAADMNVAVLLIDAAPRAGDPLAKGFLNVLDGQCTLKSAVARDLETGLLYLPAGTSATGARETLTAERLDGFFKMVGRSFDIVLFHAAPVLETLGAAPIAAAVDDIVFVALRGGTSQKEVVDAADAVWASSGRPVSATLLIDAPGWR